MKKSLAIVLLALCGTTAVLTGCGSSAKVDTRSTTVGQELKDLDDARNKGLLTEDEYQKKRAQIMKQN